MNILHKKLGQLVFREFEDKLNEFERLDQQITDELKEIEEESIIVEHKAIFFRRRKINPDKVDIKKLGDIETKLIQLERLYARFKDSFGKVKSAFKNPDAYERKLIGYLESEFRQLFKTIISARKKCTEINEYLAEFAVRELLDDITLLDSDLEKIRGFIRQIRHYSTFLEERSRQKPYIDAKIVIKADSYRADLKRYASFKRNVLEAETKIETWPDFVKRLHEPLSSGRYKGKLHARVTGNLRIIYSWDPEKKILAYERIITHNEMDKA